MNTDDLIETLARRIEPAPPAKKRTRFAVAAVAGLGLGGALLMSALGVRPDIGAALAPVLLKAGFAAAFALAGLALAVRLAAPGRGAGRLAGLFGALFGIAAIAAVAALLIAPAGERMAAWTGGRFPWCLVLIPILGAPAAAVMTWIMRDLAPTRLAPAGAAIGAAAGGIGAMAYAMYCPVDQVAFVATWYALAIALSAAVGAVVISRFIKW
jgi:hypothetical protein